MITWLLDHWITLLSLLTGGGGVGALIRYSPRLLRRLALLVDCEADRMRWEESDKLRDHRDRLRDGEIVLLRTTVENLQRDIQRLHQYYATSGAGFATAVPDADTTFPPSPETTSKPARSAT